MPRLLPLTAVVAFACTTALPARADTEPTSTLRVHSITTQYSDGSAETFGPDAASSPQPGPADEPPKGAAPPREWQVLASDQTVRQALARWAGAAGWTFGPDQWEVPFDLPLTATATFPADDFTTAALQLQDAIALTETPLRLCFYANRVLRVLPYNAACDRTTARAAR